jgi:hypothetical protein
VVLWTHDRLYLDELHEALAEGPLLVEGAVATEDVEDENTWRMGSNGHIFGWDPTDV